MGQLTKAQRKMIIRQPGHGPKNGDTFINMVTIKQGERRVNETSLR